MARKVTYTTVAIVLLMQMFYFCECYLRQGDEGVCELRVTANDFRSRPSGYSGIVKMDETGTNYYILVCCNKYEYDTESGRCIPTCDPPCINGTCIGGNTCECEAPLTLIDGSCVAPTCTNCEHGDCTAPDVCVCHPGYIRSEGTCKKFCDKPCISGQCVGSNVCKCHGTFMLDPNDSFKYIPCDDNHELKCIVTCRHGYCLPPTDCTCVPRKKSSIFKINF